MKEIVDILALIITAILIFPCARWFVKFIYDKEMKVFSWMSFLTMTLIGCAAWVMGSLHYYLPTIF